MKNKKQKNKICVSIIIVLLLFITLLAAKNTIIGNKLSASINPSTNSIGIECSKNDISVGETISCILKGNAIQQIQLFEGKLVGNSNIEITNIQKSSIWVIGSNDSKMQYISNGTIGTFDIATFNVKGVKDGNGSIEVQKLKKSPLAFTSKNLTVYNLAGALYNIKVGTGDNNSGASYGEVNNDNENIAVNNANPSSEKSNSGTSSSKENNGLWVPQTGQIVIKYYAIIFGIVVVIVSLIYLKKKNK